MLYGHGDDGYRYANPIRADFSTNVWYGGEPKGLKAHVVRHWPSVNRYPEVVAESLCQKIGLHHGLAPGNILVANGTAESIYLIAQAFRSSATTIIVPTFSEYEDACRLHGHRLRFLPWEQWEQLPQPGTGLCFICHPNNPTGQTCGHLDLLVENHPGTLFVIDEAFIDFAPDCPSLVQRVKDLPNLIVLRSLTKVFAIPGLRLGYMVAGEPLLQKIQAFKTPWTVNALAMEAGHFIFDHYAGIRPPVHQLLRDKEIFLEQLARFPLQISKSSTHFFLATMKKGNAGDLKAYLLERHGILIRDASNFRGLTDKHFRLATLSPFKNRELVKALTAWEQHCS